MIYFSLFIYIVIILLSASKLNFNNKFSLLFIGLIGCLYIFNRQNQDYNAYVIIFENPKVYAEYGYVILVGFIKSIGGNHNILLAFLGVFFICTFYNLYRLSERSKYFSFLLLFYFLFPMSIDIVQIRNTIAMLLFVNSLVFLVEDKKIKSLFCVLLAPMFHVFGILYIIVWVFIHFRDYKYYKRIMLFISFSSFFMFPFISGFILLIDGLRSLGHYLISTPKYHSFFIWGVPFIIDVFMLNYFIKRIKVDNYKIYRVINIFYYTIVTFSIFLVCILYLDEFNRLLRTEIVLKYFLSVIIAPYLSGINRIYMFLYIVLITCIYAAYYMIELDYDYILFGL